MYYVILFIIFVEEKQREDAIKRGLIIQENVYGNIETVEEKGE